MAIVKTKGSIWTDPVEANQLGRELVGTEGFTSLVKRLFSPLNDYERDGADLVLNLVKKRLDITGHYSIARPSDPSILVASWSPDDVATLKELMSRYTNNQVSGPFGVFLLDEAHHLITLRKGDGKIMAHPLDMDPKDLVRDTVHYLRWSRTNEGLAALIDLIDERGLLPDLLKKLAWSQDANRDLAYSYLLQHHLTPERVLVFLEGCAHHTVMANIIETIEACIDLVGLDRIMDLARENNGFLNQVQEVGQAKILLKSMNGTKLRDIVTKTYTKRADGELSRLLGRMYIDTSCLGQLKGFRGQLVISPYCFNILNDEQHGWASACKDVVVKALHSPTEAILVYDPN